MEHKFGFVIEANSPGFEENYIKKCKCPCGEDYVIVSKEKMPQGDIIYNLITTRCERCYHSGQFVFDITERERKSSPRRGFATKINNKIGVNTGSSLYGKNVDNSGEKNKIENNRIEKNSMGKRGRSSSSLKDKEPGELAEEVKRLNLLYSQVIMKNRFLEEEIKLLQLMEEKLNRKEKEIKKLQNTIDRANSDLSDARAEIGLLNQKILEKEQDIQAYKNLMEESKKPRWRRLLGGH